MRDVTAGKPELRATARAFLAAALVTLAPAPIALAQNATPTTTELLQLQYVKQVSSQIDAVVSGMSPDLFQSDPFFSSRAAVHPDGKLAALALSREQEGQVHWAVLILNKNTLEVTQVYDYIRADHLNRMEWSPDGSFLLVLAEDVALTGPPGSLSVIDPRSKRAFVIDRAVWEYSLSPDSKELVYERLASTDQLFGKRELIHCAFWRLLEMLRDPEFAVNSTPREAGNAAREKTTRKVTELDFPREQLEGFKSWSSDGKTLHFSTYRYAPGAQTPSRVRFALDLASEKATELK